MPNSLPVDHDPDGDVPGFDEVFDGEAIDSVTDSVPSLAPGDELLQAEMLSGEWADCVTEGAAKIKLRGNESGLLKEFIGAWKNLGWKFSESELDKAVEGEIRSRENIERREAALGTIQSGKVEWKEAELKKGRWEKGEWKEDE